MTGQIKIMEGDCLAWLRATKRVAQKSDALIDVTFLDPPFNQGHFYRKFDDSQCADEYWSWIGDVLVALRAKTSEGGALYFMHREKNAEFVLSALREAGWTFQNLIIWKKMTSAVPCRTRFGKHYQIIVLATNGARAKTFHQLRIDPPPLPHHKHVRQHGVYATDVWDDIREMTSGYYAGAEPLRNEDGNRFHKEQSPVALLLRIILSSSNSGDLVFDPFAGTGTTLVVAQQLHRRAIGVEVDVKNVQRVKTRLRELREPDRIDKFFAYYRHTENVYQVWGASHNTVARNTIPSISSERQIDERVGLSSLF